MRWWRNGEAGFACEGVRSVLLAAFRAVGLALALTLLAAWLFQPVPLVLKILPASLLFLSGARPAAGLVVLAGIGPMANAISLWAQSPLAGIRLLEQLVLAFVAGAGCRWWRRSIELRLGAPAALVAASAAASLVAVQPALLLQRMPELSLWDHVGALLGRGDYFVRSNVWDPLFFAALTLEGIALAVTAERIVRRDPGAAERTIRMAVVGHAGVAALNLQQVVGAAIRSGDAWQQIARIVRGVRVSLFYDVNAAGSIFLLTGLSGVGLIKGARHIRWDMVTLLALIALGLWLAGSRIALLALALTLVGMLGLAAWTRRGRVRWLAGLAIAGIVVAGALGTVLDPGRNVTLGRAAAARRIMAQTSLNMWRSAPVFGVGVGRFYEESARFGSDALRQEVGFPTGHENAHNYFLQILSTEGVVGLAALLLVLSVALVPAIRAERTVPVFLRRWLVVGILACLITWLTGHPQLVPEAAFAFWLLLGVLAGLSLPPVPRSWWTAVVVAAALLLVTAPFRAAHAIRQADFDHIAVGLSHWQPEIDGHRYRQAGAAFALYLPADGRSVELPLRRAPEAPDPLVVTISDRGSKIYEPLISGDTWQLIRLQLPKSSRRFARVEFAVKSVGAGALPTPVLYVGKAEAPIPFRR
jgi:O-antigen ligase